MTGDLSRTKDGLELTSGISYFGHFLLIEQLLDILKAMRSDVAPRRRAAALGLAAIAGSNFDFDAEQGAEHNREALRRAELWYLKNR